MKKLQNIQQAVKQPNGEPYPTIRAGESADVRIADSIINAISLYNYPKQPEQRDSRLMLKMLTISEKMIGDDVEVHLEDAEFDYLKSIVEAHGTQIRAVAHAQVMEVFYEAEKEE